ncbi:MAG: thioesterase [Bacteroidales bacterium]|nr:thioesterase [Bacteroidales bacterium]
MKFSTVYPITAAQIDANYRLNVDGLLTFHENTVARYFTTLRLAAFDLQREDKTWVISEINLELPEPPSMWSEDVEVTVWASERTSLRVWMEFTARERHSGRITARGSSCWSLISMTERTLVPCGGLFPEEELVPEFAAGPHRKRTVMKHAPEAVARLGHTVNLIDLDFNGHTNNRRYIQMALVSFGPDFLAAHRPDFLNIRFFRESRLGERIENVTHPTEDPATFVGCINNGAGEEICRVSSHWTPREPLKDIADANWIR